MLLPIGARIGPYEVIGALGSGGMGDVYRARDRKLDRDVALKVLPEGFAADADRLMRFTREAKTLAALNHPHIAQVYDAGRLRPEGASAGQAREGSGVYRHGVRGR
jgi:serine/threonine protein kinase